MKCPNCKKTFDTGVKCPYCKVDTVLYKGIVRLSEKYYNQGLANLKKSNFTSGIELLNKSISVDKHNIMARNLLGLALFEVGHVGDALKHWLISCAQQSNDNPAEGYIARVRKNVRGLEKLADSITMYNIALSHIRQKSDDLAIIQLKRAADYNPGFIDALNLLTLCHMIQNDRDKAVQAAEKVLAIDVGNPIAQGYLATLNAGKPKPTKVSSITKARPVKAVETSPFKPMGIQEEKSSGFPIGGIFAFVVGAVIASAVLYFLVFPALQQEGESEVAVVRQEIAALQQEHEQQLRAITADNNELQITNSALTEEIEAANQAAVLQNRIALANQAYFLFLDNQYAEAVDILDNMDRSELPYDVTNRVNTVYTGSFPYLANYYFNEGDAAYRAEDYYRALVALERAFRFMDGGTNLTAIQQRRLLSVLATLYENNERWEEAHARLTLHLELFPQHYVTAINNRLSDIEEHL